MLPARALARSRATVMDASLGFIHHFLASTAISPILSSILLGFFALLSASITCNYREVCFFFFFFIFRGAVESVVFTLRLSEDIEKPWLMLFEILRLMLLHLDEFDIHASIILDKSHKINFKLRHIKARYDQNLKNVNNQPAFPKSRGISGPRTKRWGFSRASRLDSRRSRNSLQERWNESFISALWLAVSSQQQSERLFSLNTNSWFIRTRGEKERDLDFFRRVRAFLCVRIL